MAYGITSQKFLCCLPVRICVFLLSFLEFLSAGIIAGLLWFAVLSKDHHFDGRQKTAAIILASLMTILFIVCLCGFIGSVIRSRSLVSLYSSTLAWLLGFSLGTGIFYIVEMFSLSKAEFTQKCEDGTTDQDAINACQHVNETRFIVTGWLIFQWLIHLYVCIVVNRYVKQLEEEDSVKYHLKDLSSGVNPVYQRAGNRDSLDALATPKAAPYAYSDANHSFGSGAQA
ncbi:hypothetical protein SCHPADRAFT_873754 [Schizopora paradoxa]|uniref:Uncharacterized protein n=1 Tax=Schizopora paradoxa TaxID=27342 RepID=A0A0H2RP59_9AGAM|nr:hypothetical protein SCHPADRAFT_873754 [Schizopora paradoxa]